MKRALSPHLNPAGYMAAIGAVYAVAIMIWNAYRHHGIIDPQVVVAALAAVAALLTRQVVTPVGDPKDGNGKPLVSPPGPVIFGTGGSGSIASPLSAGTGGAGGTGATSVRPPNPPAHHAQGM